MECNPCLMPKDNAPGTMNGRLEQEWFQKSFRFRSGSCWLAIACMILASNYNSVDVGMWALHMLGSLASNHSIDAVWMRVCYSQCAQQGLPWALHNAPVLSQSWPSCTPTGQAVPVCNCLSFWAIPSGLKDVKQSLCETDLQYFATPSLSSPMLFPSQCPQ